MCEATSHSRIAEITAGPLSEAPLRRRRLGTHRPRRRRVDPGASPHLPVRAPVETPCRNALSGPRPTLCGRFVPNPRRANRSHLAPSAHKKTLAYQGFSAIGAPGFEPGTSPTRTVRATRLRHAPNGNAVCHRPARAGLSAGRPVAIPLSGGPRRVDARLGWPGGQVAADRCERQDIDQGRAEIRLPEIAFVRCRIHTCSIRR